MNEPPTSEATRRPAREEPGMDPREMPEAGREDTRNWWLPVIVALLLTLVALAFVAWHLRPGDEGILSYDGHEESAGTAVPGSTDAGSTDAGSTDAGSTASPSATSAPSSGPSPPAPSPQEEEAPPPD